MDDDKALAKIANDYKKGKMLTGELKKITIQVVSDFIEQHQKARALVTDEVVSDFFNRNRKFDVSREKRDPLKLESDDVYDTYGINFDQHFGA